MQDTGVYLTETLARLARMWEGVAERATTPTGQSRGMQLRKVAEDLRYTLTTGRLPAYLNPAAAPTSEPCANCDGYATVVVTTGTRGTNGERHTLRVACRTCDGTGYSAARVAIPAGVLE
ncbi:hypothetical protein [Streptomyces hydrogenans]|uniref:hypothetical protein n=1 Tax=Streptomyces hydrogenans TaxID=1873719 RepID=UPI003D73EF87